MNTTVKTATTKLIALLLAAVLLVSSSGCLPLMLYDLTTTEHVSNPDINKHEEVPAEGLYNDLSFDELCDVFFAHEVSFDNLFINQLVVDPEAMGIEVPRPATLGDYSYESGSEDYAFYKELLEAFRNGETIQQETLSEQQETTKLVVENVLELTLQRDYFYYHEAFLAPSTGIPSSLPFNFMDYSFRTVDDIEIYLELVQDIPRLFEQLVSLEKEKVALQLMMPKVAMEDSIEEARAYIGEVETHVLVAVFDEILDAAVLKAKETGATEGLAALTEEEVQDYKQQNRYEIEHTLVPAYEYLVAELEALLPSCNEGTRLCDYERGTEFYELKFQAMGFVGGASEAATTLELALDAYWQKLSTNSSINTMIPESVVHAIGDTPESYIAYIQAHSASEFAPASNLSYEIKVAPDASPNDYAMAYFLLPPVDDPQKNTIVFFPKNIADDVELFSTIAHEGYPGHMYQIYAYSLEQPHAINKVLGSLAYTEGWAMYAQARALYTLETDPASIEAYALFEKFVYGLYARVDIGVNFEGWTVEDTENYLYGWGYESMAQSLYDIVITQPVSYLSYGLGVIEFDDLRARAEAQLGANFNAVEFHHQITSLGAVPFDVLESKMEVWLRNAQSEQL